MPEIDLAAGLGDVKRTGTSIIRFVYWQAY